MGDNLSLTVFTICLQASIGIMLFVAIGRMINSKAIYKRAVVVSTALGIVGMLVSLLHLGRPLIAYNALLNFSTSWLSREIWFTSFFVGLTLVITFLVLKKPLATKLITSLVVLATVVGLVNVLFMANIYGTASVPLWNSAATYVEFYAATISMGAMLFFALSLKEAEKTVKVVIPFVAIAVAIQIAFVTSFIINIGASSDQALQASLVIMDGLKVAVILKWLLIAIGTGLVLWFSKDSLSKRAFNLILGSTTLIIIGQIVGRYVFYASMVITGISLT